MSRRDKLVERALQRPTAMRFSEIRRLVEMHGWEMAKPKGSSHFVFKKAGQFPITIPVHNERVEDVYIDQICKRLGLDD